VGNQNAKGSSNRRDEVGSSSLSATMPTDLFAGQDGSETDKTRISTRGDSQ